MATYSSSHRVGTLLYFSYFSIQFVRFARFSFIQCTCNLCHCTRCSASSLESALEHHIGSSGLPRSSGRAGRSSHLSSFTSIHKSVFGVTNVYLPCGLILSSSTIPTNGSIRNILHSSSRPRSLTFGRAYRKKQTWYRKNQMGIAKIQNMCKVVI